MTGWKNQNFLIDAKRSHTGQTGANLRAVDAILVANKSAFIVIDAVSAATDLSRKLGGTVRTMTRN